MNIKWYSPALHDLQRIKNRCKSAYGTLVADHATDAIEHLVNLLAIFPNLGPLEALLSHRVESWRSFVVHKNIKVIYLIGSETVNIAALWDTRQRPEKMADYIDLLAKADPAILNEPFAPYIKTEKQ